jgi:hypothetical protein
MGEIDRSNVLFKKKIKRAELINWAKSNGADFNNDSSIEAIKYFLYDFKEDLIKHFNSLMTFKVESVNIEEINLDYVNIIFEIEASYPSFHKPAEKKNLMILVDGAELYDVNYSGFEIDFKPC